MTTAPRKKDGGNGTKADAVAVQLRSCILSGEFQPGERMREEPLARWFNTGRGPVREALSRLEERGLLERTAFVGYSIRSLSLDDIRDYYTLRRTIELLATELCWPRRDRGFHRNLALLHDRLKNAVQSGQVVEAIEAEARFHGAIYLASGNEPLLRCWKSFACYRDLFYLMVHHFEGVTEDTEGPKELAHQRLFEALTGDDLEQALEVTRTHIDHGLATFERAYARKYGPEEAASWP